MLGRANCVLRKSSVFIGIWMAYRRTDPLNIVVRHLVRISAQRRQFQATIHRLAGKGIGQATPGINPDWAEDVFPSEHRREKVVDFCEQRVRTKLPRIAIPFMAYFFSKMQPLLMGLPRQDG